MGKDEWLSFDDHLHVCIQRMVESRERDKPGKNSIIYWQVI
jgi:hypothetical protein